MGEEKKDKTDNLQSVMDAVAEMVNDYGSAVEEYAYQKAQLDMLRRYICTSSYLEKDKIMKLMGWEDGEH